MSRFVIKKTKVKDRGSNDHHTEYYVYDTKLKCSIGGTTPLVLDVITIKDKLNDKEIDEILLGDNGGW